MGESGNTWELVKSNDLGPTKGGLYKGMGANGERVVFLGFEREKRREGNKERERERERIEIKGGNTMGMKSQREQKK